MTDLRLELDQLLQDYGHYILLIRQDKKVKIPKSYKNNLGLRYAYTIEKHICRSETASVPETLPRINQGQLPGEMAIASKMFYLKHDVRPQKGDLIVEIEWDKDKPIIDEYTSIYEINYPEPLRGDGGRIEYFRVACRLDPIESTLRLQKIAGKDYAFISDK